MTTTARKKKPYREPVRMLRAYHQKLLTIRNQLATIEHTAIALDSCCSEMTEVAEAIELLEAAARRAVRPAPTDLEAAASRKQLDLFAGAAPAPPMPKTKARATKKAAPPTKPTPAKKDREDRGKRLDS